MKRFKVWTLTQNNTSPFIIVAVFYCLFLGAPFIYFLHLKGQEHPIENYVDEEIDENGDSYEAESQTPKFIYDTAYNESDTNRLMIVTRTRAMEKQKSKIQVSDSAANNVVTEWRNDPESKQYVLVTRLALFSAILVFGAIGAAVSLITRARNKIEIGAITPLELISIQTIGGIFACMLFLLFMGEFISGRLFPNPDLVYSIIYVHPAFAKVLVWSFIAGFFERFVPNMLSNLAKQADDNKEEQAAPDA